MERVPRGEQASPVQNLTDIILRVAAATVSAKDDFCAADDINWRVRGRLEERSSGFVVFTTNHLHTTTGSCLKMSDGFCLLFRRSVCCKITYSCDPPVKGALCSFGKDILIRIEKSLIDCICINKLNKKKSSLCFHD